MVVLVLVLVLVMTPMRLVFDHVIVHIILYLF